MVLKFKISKNKLKKYKIEFTRLKIFYTNLIYSLLKIILVICIINSYRSYLEILN